MLVFYHIFMSPDIAVRVERKGVLCQDFILCAVGTFWAMLLVGIYPGRASSKRHHT